VIYGQTTNNLTQIVTDPTPTTEHTVRLSGLSPATGYSYSIGSPAETLAEGADCRFETAPPAGQAAPTRVWVTGDSGSLSFGSVDVLAMRDAYNSHAGARHTDVWLILGDNSYEDGTDQEYQTNFFGVFSSTLRQTAPWPTIGNHETYSATPDGRFSYLDVFSFITNGEAGGVASVTPKYYSFDHANIHFVSLDAMTQSRAADGAMANWLRTDLAATTNQWIIAFWHHPPYTKGSHDSDTETELVEMRQNIVPILEAHGVDLVLCGHSHNYERSFLLRGHYGISTTLQASMILDSGSGREEETGPYRKRTSGPLANQGTVYIVAGNSASYEPRIGHHPAMFTDDLPVGSVVLEINSNRLDAVFLRSTGAIADKFTIIKGNPEPLHFTGFEMQDGNTIARWTSIRGQTYAVERTDNLESPSWQPVSPEVVALGATTSWTNAINTTTPATYYRVVQRNAIGDKVPDDDPSRTSKYY
jgi:hypothetical protein